MSKPLEDCSREELIETIKSLKLQKKFGLVWEDKPEQVAEDCKKKLPILIEDADKRISVASDENTHLIIEGDNYHALSVLNYTHAGKIDVIYIDPPYNTGNKDFLYNDNYVDAEDTFRHSKWLSFMEKRLRFARMLLKEDGIIFISIDDNEQSTLKLLCDDIFGESNFVETLMVEMSNTGGMKVGAAKLGKIAKNGEYVLVYAKSQRYTEAERTPLYDFVSGFDTHFNLYIENNGNIIKLVDVIKNNSELVAEFKHFGISEAKISLKVFARFFNSSPIFQKFATENVKNIVRPRNEIPNIPDDISLEFGKWTKYISSKRPEPYFLTLTEKQERIQLVPMDFNYRLSDDFEPKYGRTVIRGDYWKNFWIDMGNISKEGGVGFENGKKPVRLIKQLLKWSIYANKEAAVLDFFAGSGTTGQAVLELNQEDGGHRQFILCTNNENRIAEEVTYPRVKTVITGKRGDGSTYSDGISANLRYFRTDFIDKNDTLDKLRRELSPACEDMIRIREGAFEKIVDDDMFKVFKNSRGLTAVIYDRFDLDNYIEKVEALETDAPVHLYVFSYDNSDRTDQIPKTAKHVYESQPIPEGVLEVYKRIFK